MRRADARLQRFRLRDVLLGAGRVALAALGQTAVEEGIGIFRVELDGLIEIGDGLGVVALGGVGIAPIVIGAGFFGSISIA